VLSRRVAHALGFTSGELIAQPDIEVVGGQMVSAYSAPDVVLGQLRDDSGAATHLWGPEFVLDALFVAYEDILLGRVDFFNAFNVVFSPDGPTMHIYEL
jgi:hypothetical protein